MAEAYIVEAVRTAGGRRNGRLSGWHPVDLGAAALNAIVDRTGIDPAAIEDVVMGCVGQTYEQGGHIGRNAVLASKLPESVPSVSIDRQCGSSQQAIQFAAQAILSGTQDVVLAAGVESMSRVPMGSTGMFTKQPAPNSPKSPGLQEHYPDIAFSQFMGAELIAKKWGFTREDLDTYAVESHRRAAAATNAGAFEREIIALDIETANGHEKHTKDEGIRYDATLESIGSVRLLQEGGMISAASASQICDGSSAVLVVSERALKTHGLTPLARIHNFTVTGGDPVLMLEEPLYATKRALERAGLKIEDIDLYEVNEAFAPVPLAWLERQRRRHRARPPARRFRHQADGNFGSCAARPRQEIRPANNVRRRRTGECDDCRGAALG
jgi:acetyl-CoA C-acetyltransferase